MSRMIYTSLVVLAAACGGSKSESTGACVVEYDDLGDTGTACTVDKEARCKTAELPAMRPDGLGQLKMKSFAAGKRCADVGYQVAGCRDVAIAWSFARACP